MPSDAELHVLIDEWKQKGNTAFGKGELDAAVSAYSQGLVQVDRTTAASSVKAALLSNRAACFLKQAKLQECRDDCSSALTVLDNTKTTSTGSTDQEALTKLRSKLLYRRAKSLFLQANMPHKKQDNDLQDAAKDLLTLLSFDATNKEATNMLTTIRAQHAQESKHTAKTPLSKTLEAIRNELKKQVEDKSNSSTESLEKQLKVLLGLLNNDNQLAPMELGRTGGVPLLLDLATNKSGTTNSNPLKARYLALQCLSCAGTHPPFCRQFLCEATIQEQLSSIMITSCSSSGVNGDDQEDDLVVGALTVYLRLILHLDRDDEKKQEAISGVTLLQYQQLMDGLIAAFSTKTVKILRAAMDVLSTWTSGTAREGIIRASLDSNVVDLPIPLTKMELHQLTPKEMSDYKQRKYHKKTRDEAWAFERARLFCHTTQTNGTSTGLAQLLECNVICEDASLRREMTVILGRVLAALEADPKIKEAVGSFFNEEAAAPPAQEEKDAERPGVIIEELDEDNEEEVGKVTDVTETNGKPKATPQPLTMGQKLERTALSTALLMSKGELGAWSMGANAWPSCSNDLDSLVESNDKTSLCMVAELLSAAASVKETRPMVGTYLSNTNMKSLVSHSDRDVRTAAASSVAKLGLAEQGTEDIELIGLLEAACYMLEDGEEDEEASPVPEKFATTNIPSSTSGATTSLERGIEVLTYLVSKTIVKEELAHGFRATKESKSTGLELLVKACDKDVGGASIASFGLASTFQLMAVTPLALRKEAFEGKQITMEQYDEIKKMEKTEEQKEMNTDEEPELKEDSPEQCATRIAKMANAGVPRALVQLTKDASDQTLEQTIMALNRMANEPAVRGTMIQQGVLTNLIKLEKEEKNPSDIRKKILRLLRQCMGRMFITTNPTLLTAAQRMGSIKPLIQLIREIESSDLQKFEALMALTNVASSGDDAKNRIVAEKGLSTLKYAMFSDHEMVKQAATECLCNMVPNAKFLESLREADELRLWLALASDFEDNFACARAAAGTLAMATGDPEICKTLIELPKFKERMDQTLESGSLEIMHRMLVVVQNLAEHGGEYLAAADKHGLLAFAQAYVQSYHDGSKAKELDFSAEDLPAFNATVDVAKQILKAADSGLGQ